MIYEKRYVQFNDLVIDSYDMIEYTESDLSFKYISHDKTFGHGNYAPFKRDYVFAEEASVSLTLRLHMKKLPCNERPFYRRFVISELSRPGKLWAVQNNELVWAYAVLTNKGEQYSYRKDLLVISVDFTLPEGIWHKADKQKTFLRDYDVCTFMDCYDFRDYDPCENLKKMDGNCCTVCGGADEHDAGCNCCVCDTICEDMALCFNQDRLQNVFNDCGDGIDFHIVYNCAKAQEFFGDEYIGQKFCTKDSCTGIIAGLVYADTDIPTNDFTITLHGSLLSPSVTINGNTNVIEGDYTEYQNGIMTIKSNGQAFFRSSDCCEDEEVAAGAWIIPQGNEYGWTLNPGNNRVVINTNSCCGVSCAYINVNGLTI